MRVDKLAHFEQETLNRFLLQHMGQETRGKLMVECPVIYRKLLGGDADEAFRTAVKDTVLDRCGGPKPDPVAVAPEGSRFHKILSVVAQNVCGEISEESLEKALENIEEDE